MNPTQTGIAVALALVVIIFFFVFNGMSLFSRSTPQEVATTTTDQIASTTDSTSSPQAASTTPVGDVTKLQVTDEVVGTGTTAVAGDVVVVAYTGSLTSGKIFDSSVGKPVIKIPGTNCPTGVTTGLCMKLGAGQVIKGWDQGLVGMKEGGNRKLVIPASLGYGSQAMGDAIPANSTLVFEVELLKVQK